MVKIGQSRPQQWSEYFTAAYMGFPPPTRWSMQRANGKYKDHLVGQLTTQVLTMCKNYKFWRLQASLNHPKFSFWVNNYNFSLRFQVKFCNKTFQLLKTEEKNYFEVRLVSSPREWVERESGDIHLWLSIAPSLQNKQVWPFKISFQKHIYRHQHPHLTTISMGVIQVQILVTPFRVRCGSTERHWVHCSGTDACIRRS